MPLILSINTNINEFSLLLSNKDFINRIFKNYINIYNINYNLIAFITQPSDNHFICYFKCLKEEYPACLHYWFKYDDVNGVYKELKNFDLSLNNIQQSEAITILVYLKTN